MNEQTLREKARAAIASGRFPNRRQDRTWGGPGVGAQCTICGLAVRADQMEFQVEFAHDGIDPGLETYHVHVPCFAAWEFEREATGPTCDVCLMRILPDRPVVFRDDGRIEHVECPTLRCIRCLRAIQAGDATRRIGDDVVHGTCPETLGTGTTIASENS